jgi:hypothetical protein
MKRGIKKNDSEIGECSVDANIPLFLEYTQRRLQAKSRLQEEGNGEEEKRNGTGCHRGHPIQACYLCKTLSN